MFTITFVKFIYKWDFLDKDLLTSLHLELWVHPLSISPYRTILQQTTLKSSGDKYGKSISRILKTLWQKEKLLIMRDFFLCHNVFKSRLLQSCQKWVSVFRTGYWVWWNSFNRMSNWLNLASKELIFTLCIKDETSLPMWTGSR